MNKKLELIIKKINEAGGKIYFVGGYVRDKIMGRENKDIDVEIHNITIEKTKEILSLFGKVDLIGVSFGVLKISGLDVDFTFPRTEKATGDKHTDFEVTVDPFLSLEVAASRRDFTMNAIMEDALTGEIFDFFGGLDDIENKTIKFVDEKTFVDDSLRPLRAAQFAARFNMTIDDKLMSLSKTMDFTHLSIERISVELEKAFKAEHPSIAFEILSEMGVFTQIAPEFDEMKLTEQNPEWHPEGNVFNHTMLVLDAAAKFKNQTSNPTAFMWFALLHDVGKIKTTKLNSSGNWAAPQHEKVGAEMIPSVMSKLTKETKMVPYVTEMTKNHMYPHKLLLMKKVKVRRLMVKANMNDLMTFNLCDMVGKQVNTVEIKETAEFYEKMDLLHSLEQGGDLKVVPMVKGSDLIELGFSPGPQFSTLLEFALELQIQDKTKEQIIKSLRKKKQ